MEWLRVGRDVWGRETIQGLSWDLLPVFFFAGVFFVLAHAAYRRFLAPKR